jgi:hypothetical protein
LNTPNREQTVHDGQTEPAAALTELRNQLTDGLARAQLTKMQLATRAKRGRTTVQEAFRPGAPVPSAETVAALAGVLPVEQLLDLRRVAAGETVPETDQGPGKPIGEWDPHHLEVHPAGSTTGRHEFAAPERVLSRYVRRPHDQALADAVQAATQGYSQMVVLVGSSSTGKTRACWEAVQPLAQDEWRLWHPFDPTRAAAALDELEHVGSRTVVWLNEAQHYLGDPRLGEQIAAAVHTLLTHPERRPVLVLGTLWPEYVDQYIALPRPDAPDPHSRARELLTGRTLTVPETFDQEALREATALADGGDRLLADALTRTRSDGRVTQDLAGAPELLRRYEHGTPAARAVLEAAMDARRLGVGLHLPQAFLTDAAIDYLSNQDYNALTEDWAEAAFADLARPVHGKQAPLRRTGTRPRRRPPGSPEPVAGVGDTRPVFRLADYLEQHGHSSRRALCPPGSFWAAAHTHLTHTDDLNSLAHAARYRCRYQWAYHLARRAAEAGDASELGLVEGMPKLFGHRDRAEAHVRHGAEVTDYALALSLLAGLRERAGYRDGAEALAREAADAGFARALFSLALTRQKVGDWDGAEALAREAADAGYTAALDLLAQMREWAGYLTGGLWETVARIAAVAGDTEALVVLAWRLIRAGDREGVEALAREAADAGSTEAVILTALMLNRFGDRKRAEALAREAADAGSTAALAILARMRQEVGDWDGAEALAREAADAGSTAALVDLVQMRERAGDRDGAEALAWEVAHANDALTLVILVPMRHEVGDWGRAEALAWEAANAGYTEALVFLARMRETAGDRDGAESLFRQFVDRGHIRRRQSLARGGHIWDFNPRARWPYGLDPDGTPTPPWQ